jgi:ribose transport system permease protein
MIVGFAVAKPQEFPTLANLKIILDQASLLAIVAGGLTLVLISWDFDLSIGAMMTLAGIVVSLLLNHGWPLGLAIIATLVMAASFGIINGLVVAKLNISAFIATLAMMSILTGLGDWWSNFATVSAVKPAFLNLATDNIDGIDAPVIVAFLVLVGAYVVLEHTKAGRRLYAVGSNMTAARIVGIRPARVRIACFSLCATAAGLAGILLASLLTGGYHSAGDPFLLQAFAAAFLGAVTLRFGQFHILGTTVGVLILTVLTNGLAVVSAPEYVNEVAQGIILIVAVAAAGLAVKSRGR